MMSPNEVYNESKRKFMKKLIKDFGDRALQVDSAQSWAKFPLTNQSVRAAPYREKYRVICFESRKRYSLDNRPIAVYLLGISYTSSLEKILASDLVPSYLKKRILFNIDLFR